LTGLISDFSAMIEQLIEGCLAYFEKNFDKKQEMFTLLDLCFIKTEAGLAEKAKSQALAKYKQLKIAFRDKGRRIT